MKKCSICGQELSTKTLGLDNILDNKEKKRLRKLRIKNRVCSECKMQMLILDITG